MYFLIGHALRSLCISIVSSVEDWIKVIFPSLVAYFLGSLDIQQTFNQMLFDPTRSIEYILNDSGWFF